MTLEPGETIITAWAEHAKGPGWSNRLVWVLVQRPDTTYRLDALQPEDLSDALRTLFPVSAMVSEEMTAWAKVSRSPGGEP